MKLHNYKGILVPKTTLPKGLVTPTLVYAEDRFRCPTLEGFVDGCWFEQDTKDESLFEYHSTGAYKQILNELDTDTIQALAIQDMDEVARVEVLKNRFRDCVKYNNVRKVTARSAQFIYNHTTNDYKGKDKDLDIYSIERECTIDLNTETFLDNFRNVSTATIDSCRGKDKAPILVSKHEDGTYSIIDGRHRYLAACLDGDSSLQINIVKKEVN